MSISFFAYHGQPEQRQNVIEHISLLTRQGLLSNTADNGDRAIGLLEALADGSPDPAVAFQKTGFPYPLLKICESIFQGMPAGKAPAFALELVQTAQIDADVSDIASQFMQWMIEEALSEHGKTRLQSSAKEKGPDLTKLAQIQSEVSTLKNARMLTRQAKQRGLPCPTSDEKFVHDAISLLLTSGGSNAGAAVDWISGIAPNPEAKYEQFSRRLIELVETA